MQSRAGRSPLLAHRRPLASSSRRSPSRPSSPTPPFVSASECNLKRTTRELLRTSHATVDWASSMRTTKCSLPVLVVRVTPLVISQVCDSRLRRSLALHCWPFGCTRKTSPWHEQNEETWVMDVKRATAPQPGSAYCPFTWSFEQTESGWSDDKYDVFSFFSNYVCNYIINYALLRTLHFYVERKRACTLSFK